MNTKLKISEIIAINEGMKRLDHPVDENYPSYDNGTRWNIAKNLKLLAADIEIYDTQRVAKIRKLSPEKLDLSKEAMPAQEEFRVWNDEFLKTEVEVGGLLKIKRSKLNLDANQTPFSVLVAIMPIVDDDGEPAATPAK